MVFVFGKEFSPEWFHYWSFFNLRAYIPFYSRKNCWIGVTQSPSSVAAPVPLAASHDPTGSSRRVLSAVAVPATLP
jgi:hypothetical protein